MTINIYKTNDGKPPRKTIGGNICYTYDNESKMMSVYIGDGWVYFHDVEIMHQPDEVLVYEEWNNGKDQYGNRIGESIKDKFLKGVNYEKI